MSVTAPTVEAVAAQAGRDRELIGIPPLALRPKEAAKSLGISDRLLWSLTNRGLIPHVRIGTRIVYPVRLLDGWLAGQAAGKAVAND
jgi:excisionase family DNA binding protein